MGSRRTHEEAAVAAARAAYLAGFTGTSNLEAQRRYGVPTMGTSAHAFTLLHTGADGPDEPAAFRSQVAALGVGTTLLVDTYDITAGVANAVAVAGPELGAVRIDSGDLGVLARQVRAQLDGLGATRTGSWCRATSTSSPSPRCAPSRSTATASARRSSPARARRPRAWSTSWSRWTASRCEKRSATRSPTGAQVGAAAGQATGTVVEEVVHPADEPPAGDPFDRLLPRPLVRAGEPVAESRPERRPRARRDRAVTACRGTG